MPSELPILNIAAICLFDLNGRLLLVRKRGTQAFMLPGGKCEPGESSLNALQRELLEELELRLDVNSISLLGQFSAPAANEANTRITATVYRGALPHRVYPAAELEQLEWLEAQQPRPDNLAPLLSEHVLPALGGIWLSHTTANL
ncbi:NUDIX domain-containing protein [Pseudomonas sp. M30-35]|uniref:NUDIX hydrolase n=1 Tax=Pseudomonas sp. M30-35 TaxID=1981174 RepID=UPI000B3D0719|nr:NUDIX domain-containing protein [Pseudomonas sp. M30-35]ARU89253.1 NUDIX hydrolase [Pseudomonas sp. M30-35]